MEHIKIASKKYKIHPTFFALNDSMVIFLIIIWNYVEKKIINDLKFEDFID